MIEDFFIRALAGGIGVALAAGPLGCVVVWRRMAYFGAALAHSALLGVALGFVTGLDLTVSVLTVCVAVAGCLALLERQRQLTSDTLLGLLAHGALALGLVALAFLEHVRVDLLGYLFGDVLALAAGDLWIIYGLAATSLGLLALIWRPLLSLTVDAEVAKVEGVPVERIRLAFVLLVAAVIAIGMKVVGVLLIVSLLIIPAATARSLARGPEAMAVAAGLAGALSVTVGLFASLEWDLPAGPAIVVVAALAFVATLIVPGRRLARLGSRCPPATAAPLGKGPR